jgi:hypothetical protein
MHYHDLELHNVVELLPDGGGHLLCRVPLTLRAKLNESARANAVQAAGCELRFNLRGDGARVVLEMTERPAIAELYQGPFMVSWHVVDTRPTAIEIAPPARLEELIALGRDLPLPFDPRLTRLMLPWRPPVCLHAIEGELAPPEPGQTPPRTLLSYGSSITHGNMSVGPSATYAMRLAQHLGVDLRNLGFGGGCHLEPELAEYIVARDDYDALLFELGINLVASIDVAEFERRVNRFLEIVAEHKPDTPCFCVDMYPFHMDFGPDLRDKAAAFRRVVADGVARWNRGRMVYLSGQALLPEVTGLSADLVHPAPRGMDAIARNLADAIRGHWTP